MKTRILTLAMSIAIASASQAQFLSEIFANPPGTDQGQEFVELQGSAGGALTGYYLLAIEGDGAAAGTVDIVQNLGGYTFGSNGLLLIRDTAALLNPNPSTGTNVVIFDWTPDIENGSNTYVLGFGTPPAQGSDLDTDNDGTLDSTIPGFTVVDAIGLREADGTPADDFAYGSQLGGVDFGITVGTAGDYTADVLYRVLNTAGTAPNGWVAMDVLGSAPGPYGSDAAEFNYLGSASPAPTATDITEATPGIKNLAWPVGGGQNLSGVVTLLNSDADWSNESVVIEIADSNGNVVQTVNAGLSTTGSYSAAISVAAGTYDVYIKGDTFLRKLVGGVSISGSGASGVNATLINGDVNNDNEVGPGDFTLLSAAFGSSLGDPNYNAAADLNDDGEVGPGDFTILTGTFGQQGD